MNLGGWEGEGEGSSEASLTRVSGKDQDRGPSNISCGKMELGYQDKNWPVIGMLGGGSAPPRDNRYLSCGVCS